MKEIRIDLRDPAQDDPEESRRSAELCFKINHTIVAGNPARCMKVIPPRSKE